MSHRVSGCFCVRHDGWIAEVHCAQLFSSTSPCWLHLPHSLVHRVTFSMLHLSSRERLAAGELRAFPSVTIHHQVSRHQVAYQTFEVHILKMLGAQGFRDEGPEALDHHRDFCRHTLLPCPWGAV